MKQYIDLVNHVLDNGSWFSNRTGIDSKAVFGYQFRHDLSMGFPALTTKALAWRPMVAELMWFLEGSTDERRLAELQYSETRFYCQDKKTIWTANADEQGVALGYANTSLRKELGPVYGRQWRNFGGVDQIKDLVDQIKTNPDSRRHILNAWNVGELDKMALPPCHVFAQFHVHDNKLSCQIYQRSVDVGLGLPFNIASYALLTHIIARETDLEVGELIHTSGNLHIYKNHINSLKSQILRDTRPLPTLNINPDYHLLPYGEFYPLNVVDQFTLENYRPHPTIKMEMAV